VQFAQSFTQKKSKIVYFAQIPLATVKGERRKRKGEPPQPRGSAQKGMAFWWSASQHFFSLWALVHTYIPLQPPTARQRDWLAPRKSYFALMGFGGLPLLPHLSYTYIIPQTW